MPETVHAEAETHGWSRNLPDGHVRVDTPEDIQSRRTMNARVAHLPDYLLGRAA